MNHFFNSRGIHLPKIKGGNYCHMVHTLVKKFDLLNLVDDRTVKRLCKDLSFVNDSLGKAYEIIFNQGHDSNTVIRKLMSLRDPSQKTFINKKDAHELVAKFKKFTEHLQGGSDDPELDQALNSEDSASVDSASEDSASEDSASENSASVDSVNRGSASTDNESDMGRDLRARKVRVPPVKNMLTKPQKKVINDTFDMMEVLLICLSLLPIAGWTFDFPLLIYSLANKKYTLVMITVLNWYIWAFWLMFGMNVNLGPTMKATYLGNHENVVKKALLYPEKEPTKVINPFTNAQVRKMPDGKNYLVDKNGNVYSAEVTSPKTIGILTKDNRFVKRKDPEYEQALLNKQKFLKKDKIGPTNLS